MSDCLKRVILSGYYGFGNAGDEAILEASVKAFKGRGVEVAAWSHTPEETARAYEIEAYPRNNLGSLLHGIFRSDLVCSGGGGLFQDTTSLKSLLYYLRIPVLARLCGKKTMIFGQGIGPIVTERGRKMTRWVCNRFIHRITVRDEESKAFLQSIGVVSPIAVAADLAFLLPEPSPAEIAGIRSRLKLDSAGSAILGISLREWPGLLPNIPRFASAVSRFAEENNLFPVLLPFQYSQDAEVLRLFHNLLSVPHLFLESYLSPKELLALTANFDTFVGMRFHALVFSARCKVPFLAISYDPKVVNIGNSMGQKVLSIRDLSSSACETQMLEVWRERGRYREVLTERTASAAEKAQENIRVALELLGKNN